MADVAERPLGSSALGSLYVPILTESLRSGLVTDFDVFIRAGQDFFLIKPKNMSLDARMMNRWKSQESFLYIRSEERERYFTLLGTNLSTVVRSGALTTREKAAVLTDYAVEVVDRIFDDPGSPKNMEHARVFTQECVRYIGLQKHGFLHLVELTSHDSYTYAHSVGVAAFTIAIARDLGITRVEELSDLGLAGFLHDIGKCMVDPAIINKKGPLNENEWAIMKKHPEFGAEILRRHKNIHPVVTLAAESHHENLLGTGYPKGLIANRLDPIVRVVTLADAFSALTTKRSYSDARDTRAAFQLMKSNVGKSFDMSLYRRFVMLFLDDAKDGNLDAASVQAELFLKKMGG